MHLKLAAPDPKPGDLTMSRLTAVTRLRAAPVSVAKLWEDLWLGVISQSNLVIAGFLRNIFKYGGCEPRRGVGRALAQRS